MLCEGLMSKRGFCIKRMQARKGPATVLSFTLGVVSALSYSAPGIFSCLQTTSPLKAGLKRQTLKASCWRKAGAVKEFISYFHKEDTPSTSYPSCWQLSLSSLTATQKVAAPSRQLASTSTTRSQTFTLSMRAKRSLAKGLWN